MAPRRQIPYIDKVSGGSYLSGGNARVDLGAPPLARCRRRMLFMHYATLRRPPFPGAPRRRQTLREKGSQE